MVTILPGCSRESTGFSEKEFVIYAVESYVLLGLYLFLMVLVIVNIWTVLVKQRRYKNLPLLAFYIYAFFAIVCRLIYIIIDWSDDYLILGFYINDL